MQISRAAKLAIVALIAVALALTVTTLVPTLSAVTSSKSVASSGTITTSPNLGVFSDSACTINMTAINWGSVEAGGTITQTVYVKNVGTGTMTLSLTVSNWSPTSASTYLTISWNQQGTQLAAGQSVAAIITLTISSQVTGFTTFSNSIAISGTG